MFEGLPENYIESFEYLQSKLPDNLKSVKMAIVCGSGLNNLAEKISDIIEFDYKDIPGFAASTVQGHYGKLAFGFISKTPVVCMVGRFHYYEGHSSQKVSFPIRVFRMFGAKVLLLTNAAGGLNDAYSTGDLVIIRDHISLLNLTGPNPLRGPNESMFGPRFPAMLNAYNQNLRYLFTQAAAKCNYRNLKEGTYIYLSGPSYETPAEARFLSNFGDLVGMSTAPETTVGNHCGMDVIAISLVTNMVNRDVTVSSFKSPEEIAVEKYQKPQLSHAEVLEVGSKKAKELEEIVLKFTEILEEKEYL